MSKKKSFSGNTMTLKDFHGGSIPSDLPLPSAPGVVLRPTDWSGYDKPNAWGGSAGRTRPSSSPASRNFGDKTPFLSHTAHIGRNFDEDERKPLDGSSAPRRMISDESFRKLEPVSGGRGLGRGMGSPVLGSYSGIVSEGGSRGVSTRNVGDGSARSGGSSVPNVWTARKESAMVVTGGMQSGSSEVSIVSKMAHASAIEKVSSGMWKTNNSLPHQIDVKVVNNSEVEKAVGSRFFDDYNNNWRDSSRGKEHADVTLPRHMERGLTIEDEVQGGRKEIFDHDRVRAPLYSGINERKPWTNDDGVQRPRNDVKMSGSEIEPQVQSEPQERPKLKLLPRTKPLDTLEAPSTEHKQGYQEPSNLAYGRMENIKELQANARAENPHFAGSESENQVAERPKLNLKPRSQPLEQSDRDSERERSALFGRARPREQVLKDRGTEGAAISSNDASQHLDRYNSPKNEKMVEHTVPMRNHDRYENQPGNHRNGKKLERMDQRGDSDRVDTQRRNWRKNGRDGGRQQMQQQQHVNQERPPSPESWRKPEQPRPATPEVIAQRYTKAASAMELAQAFSRSVSDPKAADSYSNQKGLPSRNQIPFSRLVSPNERPQINGY